MDAYAIIHQRILFGTLRLIFNPSEKSMGINLVSNAILTV
jgi:hypothetical protein